MRTPPIDTIVCTPFDAYCNNAPWHLQTSQPVCKRHCLTCQQKAGMLRVEARCCSVLLKLAPTARLAGSIAWQSRRIRARSPVPRRKRPHTSWPVHCVMCVPPFADQRVALSGKQEPDVCPRPPTDKPQFTVKTLRDAIPAHCFQRSTVRSFSYLLVDLVAVAALYYASTWIDHPVVPRVLAYGCLWPLYWFFQGAVCTGIWVIAHECGHGAFSDYTWLNDLVGLVAHSCLLVPYYSWKHSHRRHHSNTGSLAKDEVFVPSTEEREVHFMRYSWYRLGFVAVQQLLGWPMYLFFNASGREYSRWASHFDPTSPIFSKRERAEVVVSDAALAVVAWGLYNLAQAYGWPWLVKTYIIPYLVVNFWLVMITYLQHTHPNLPHYEDGEWDWLRGALATVDRSYGFLDHFFHHIADTHVAHHLFSQMPHYHAEEATRALRPVLGQYYSQDKRNVFRALWEEISVCHWVAPEVQGSGITWFKTVGKDDYLTLSAKED